MTRPTTIADHLDLWYKKQCVDLLKSFESSTGYPMIIPKSVAKELRKNGITGPFTVQGDLPKND